MTTSPDMIAGLNGYDLAYVKTEGQGPCVLFLSGFKSDMQGSKATFLEAQCRARTQAFVRFDYGGHGLSGGVFTDGTIGSWTQDALHIIDQVITGDVIVVGSSMGGWIALHCALKRPERVKGLVGLAAAPDFTKRIESTMAAAQKETLAHQGYITEESGYEEPYIFTQALLDDGRQQSLLDNGIPLSIPVHLIQGKQDMAVPWETAAQIVSAVQGSVPDVTYIDDGDHSLSRPQDLEILDQVLQTMRRHV